MFGFQSYTDKLYKIKWYCLPSDLLKIETTLYVQFKQENNYFLIEKIHYSPLDILFGLEQFNFELTKNGDDIEIKILKI